MSAPDTEPMTLEEARTALEAAVVRRAAAYHGIVVAEQTLGERHIAAQQADADYKYAEARWIEAVLLFAPVELAR